MCFIRKGLDWVFTQEELRWLDDVMPEIHNRAKEDKEKEKVKKFSKLNSYESLYMYPVYAN